MSVLIAIALKSLLIGGLTLGLLHLMRKRSAAERSWVAHVGLLALMIMAFAPLVLPSWKVEAPAMLGQAKPPEMAQPAMADPAIGPILKAPAAGEMPLAAAAQPQSAAPSIDPVAAATAAYAVPAAVLLFITFLALARLVALQARAEVLVDAHWLSALARAQRRMGFKHGTALLTSNELASPISWGLMRPVILLNSRAVEATDEAEAIIAHELAHVARLDWIKLLLARVATALFWFNPLVWLLAREAHQLREETADDTVLAANIADTDYAQLLVGVARHECPGLLLGAHGVAPSKSSLARRIARVLDVKSARGPAARGFALGVFVGAVVVAAPLAALTLTPAAAPVEKASSSKVWEITQRPSASPQPEAVHADLPHLIAQGVSTSVTTAMAAVAPAAKPVPAARKPSVDNPPATEADGSTIMRNADGDTLTLYPADGSGKRKLVARDSSGNVAVSYVDHSGRAFAIAEAGGATAEAYPSVKIVVDSRAIGVTPEFIAAIRAAAPELADASINQINRLRVVGVTPEYAQSIASAGFRSVDAHGLMKARVIGVDATYLNAMRSAGVQGDLDDFIHLRSVGIGPEFIARAKAAGVQELDVASLMKWHALGMTHSSSMHWKKFHRTPSPSDMEDPDPNPDG